VATQDRAPLNVLEFMVVSHVAMTLTVIVLGVRALYVIVQAALLFLDVVIIGGIVQGRVVKLSISMLFTLKESVRVL